MLAPHTELTAAWVSVLDDLARIFEDAGLPTARVAREVQYVSRTTIGILLQEVRAPIPYVGLTEGVIRQLPAGSRRAGRRSSGPSRATATMTYLMISSTPTCYDCGARCAASDETLSDRAPSGSSMWSSRPASR